MERIKALLSKDSYTLADVPVLISVLRDDKIGCPWDREQTHQSIRKNLLEEAYEAADAIDKNDTELLREELGDVLLQVALHSEMENRSGGFDIDDVADELCRKLIARHPHVFGNVHAETGEQVLANWEQIKRAEKSRDTGAKSIDDVPAALPALSKSQKVQKRAADFGFDYTDVNGALADLENEVAELREAIDEGGNIEEELGDVIFAAVNVSRFCKVDAEEAAQRACEKFTSRYKQVETEAFRLNIDMKSCGIDTLNRLWNAAKHKSER